MCSGFRCLSAVAAGLALLPFAGVARAGQFQLETLALTGMEAPGAGGRPFTNFQTQFGGRFDAANEGPVLNAAGEVSFRASILHDPALNVQDINTEGIWRAAPGGPLERVALEPVPLPSTDDRGIFLEAPFLTESGDVYFTASFIDEATGDFSETPILRSGDPGPTRVIGLGDPITGGFTLGLSRDPAANASGEVAFGGSVLDAGGALLGAVLGPDGAGGYRPVALEGQDLPELPSGSTFVGLASGLSLTEGGQIAFRGGYSNPQDPLGPNRGIWQTDGAGGLRAIAVPGSEAPIAGETFVFVDTPRQNDAGEVAFAGLIDAGSGFFRSDRDGALSPVLVDGDPAPGLPGVTASLFAFEAGTHRGRASLNDAGEFAFRAELSGAGVGPENDRALYVQDRSGGFDLRLRKGDLVEHEAESLVLDVLSAPVLTESGALITFGTVTGDDVDGDSNEVLLYQDASSGTKIVIREGDVIEVAPGDSRELDYLYLDIGTLSTASDRVGFNDSQLVFVAYFTDGSSGILRATIPEPGTGALAALGLAALARWRRGSRTR